MTEEGKSVLVSRITAPITQVVATAILVLGGCLWLNNRFNDIETEMLKDRASSRESMTESVNLLTKQLADLTTQLRGMESRMTNAVSVFQERAHWRVFAAENPQLHVREFE